MKNLENGSEKNVFTQLSELLSGFFKSSKNKEGTYLDTAAYYAQVVIFFTAVTRIISYTFALNFFLSWVGEYSIYIALLAALLLEAAIVFIGFAFAKGIAQRKTFFDRIQFAVVLFLGLTFFVAIYYGFQMSTKGQEQIATVLNKSQYKTDSTTTLLGNNIAQSDASVEGINSEIKTGAGVKWKGRVTEDGQEIIKRAQKNQNEVLKQKTLLLQAMINRDSVVQKERKYETTAKATFTSLFGGFTELISIFSVFALGFCAAGLDKQNEESEEVITVITSNYQITAGKIVIDGKEYDRTKASQWLSNCVRRANDKSKTTAQREYYTKRAEQIGEAISEYDKAYTARGGVTA